MANSGTPKDKLLRRAKKGKEAWKLKATFRREENVKLNIELRKMENRLDKLMGQNQELNDQLASAQKKIISQEKEIEKLKKKSRKRK